jgi:hypothetical protein
VDKLYNSFGANGLNCNDEVDCRLPDFHVAANSTIYFRLDRYVRHLPIGIMTVIPDYTATKGFFITKGSVRVADSDWPNRKKQIIMKQSDADIRFILHDMFIKGGHRG